MSRSSSARPGDSYVDWIMDLVTFACGDRLDRGEPHRIPFLHWDARREAWMAKVGSHVVLLLTAPEIMEVSEGRAVSTVARRLPELARLMRRLDKEGSAAGLLVAEVENG